MLNKSLALRLRMEGYRWKILQEILLIYQSIWTSIFMIRFVIGVHLVDKRARLCLEDGSGFHTELVQACATGY